MDLDDRTLELNPKASAKVQINKEQFFKAVQAEIERLKSKIEVKETALLASGPEPQLLSAAGGQTGQYQLKQKYKGKVCELVIPELRVKVVVGNEYEKARKSFTVLEREFAQTLQQYEQAHPPNPWHLRMRYFWILVRTLFFPFAYAWSTTAYLFNLWIDNSMVDYYNAFKVTDYILYGADSLAWVRNRQKERSATYYDNHGPYFSDEKALKAAAEKLRKMSYVYDNLGANRGDAEALNTATQALRKKEVRDRLCAGLKSVREDMGVAYAPLVKILLPVGALTETAAAIGGIRFTVGGIALNAVAVAIVVIVAVRAGIASMCEDRTDGKEETKPSNKKSNENPDGE